LPTVVESDILPEPFTATDPVTSPVNANVLLVPQVAVVMFADPLNEVPLIVLGFAKVVAVVALPLNAPENVVAVAVPAIVTPVFVVVSLVTPL
tara:strand:+ start:769 stop:1047 length:279 start_codon:yes stop_codon:yes gene_type:complete